MGARRLPDWVMPLCFNIIIPHYRSFCVRGHRYEADETKLKRQKAARDALKTSEKMSRKKSKLK